MLVQWMLEENFFNGFCANSFCSSRVVNQDYRTVCPAIQPIRDGVTPLPMIFWHKGMWRTLLEFELCSPTSHSELLSITPQRISIKYLCLCYSSSIFCHPFTQVHLHLFLTDHRTLNVLLVSNTPKPLFSLYSWNVNCNLSDPKHTHPFYLFSVELFRFLNILLPIF